jgi:hypothetical protein
VLQWEPKVDFKGLIAMMVDADMERLTSATEHARALPVER